MTLREAINQVAKDFSQARCYSLSRSDIKNRIDELLCLQKKYIKGLIVKEIRIAQSEDKPTSRLTSLYMKIK